jgi:hypothetical protein
MTVRKVLYSVPPFKSAVATMSNPKYLNNLCLWYLYSLTKSLTYQL